MSLAAVAVRNQRKKQKLALAPAAVLPTAQLPGGPALLVLELGKLNARKSSADSQASSNSSSTNSEEVTKQ